MGIISELYILPVDVMPVGFTADNTVDKRKSAVVTTQPLINIKCRLALFTQVTNADEVIKHLGTDQIYGSLIKAELVSNFGRELQKI